MDKLTSLSLSIGVLSGIATYFAVGPAAGVFFIWAATIAWAAYFLLGANLEAAINTGVNGIFGVFMAWVTAILLLKIDPKVSIGVEIATALIVGGAVIVLCLSAKLPQFAVIPVGVLGYSSTFAYLLQTPDKMTQEVLLGASLNNPLLVISISFILGAVFGHLSNQLANQLNSLPNPFASDRG
ncbi:Protein of unknown function [Methylomagnum ishizawai]|uniref:DUF1097 domain-containing protein n=1 Tax=Methylomagnum ishizawai TaxID=1760988 RepID=A0A1Y6D0C0_9GAMM|nr:DUF1097 domain-containing protein [Methylomagnum ishizawai]SMF96389.1 Protein of unknown function [Methylomagnum ishizawai]